MPASEFNVDATNSQNLYHVAVDINDLSHDIPPMLAWIENNPLAIGHYVKISQEPHQAVFAFTDACTAILFEKRFAPDRVFACRAGAP